jgi:regulator of protease activity HflC (stomatin/prohibitin superfamily)
MGYSAQHHRRSRYAATALIIVLAIVVLFLLNAIKIVREYERVVVFRLGRLQGAKGPGLFFIIPIVDQVVKVDLRTVTFDVPPQEVITRDNVTVNVNAIVFFRVVSPEAAITQVEDYLQATSQICADDPAQRLGPSRARRTARRAREAQ